MPQKPVSFFQGVWRVRRPTTRGRRGDLHRVNSDQGYWSSPDWLPGEGCLIFFNPCQRAARVGSSPSLPGS